MTVQGVAPRAAAPRAATSWRVALRIARRDARRNPGRSALIFIMIMLPVLLVVAGTTAVQTWSLTPAESLPRALGAADAWIADTSSTQQIEQPVLFDGGYTLSDEASASPVRERTGDAGQVIADVLGPGTEMVPASRSVVDVGGTYVHFTAADLSDPMAGGLFRVRAGRLPTSADEAAVTPSLAGRGSPLGSTIDVDGRARTVVAVVDRTYWLDEFFTLPDQADPMTGWLVTTPGGVSWQDVRTLNAYGLGALSRQVVMDPPSADQVPYSVGVPAGDGGTWSVVAGLLAAMFLLEVVLLAGPAFAVGAVRQVRALGLVVAQGGDRRDLRRIVVAQALLIGGLAVLVGGVLGVLLPWLGYPLLVEWSAGQAGQFDARWSDVLLAMAFGLVAAVAAALVPARAVARLSPVAALAGRRPRTAAHRWPLLVGLLLVAGGAWLALSGAEAEGQLLGRVDSSRVLVAVGSVILVIGAAFLAPAALALLGWVASILPVSVRYALRDMGRSQLRTAPAVAAVVAVVAVAMMAAIIAATEAESTRADYVQAGPPGRVVVTVADWRETGEVPQTDWQLAGDAVREAVPGGQVLAVRGVAGDGSGPTLVAVQSELVPVHVILARAPYGGDLGPYLSGGWYGASLLTGGSGVAAVADVLTEEQRAFAEQQLAAGRAVVLTAWDGPAEGTLQLEAQYPWGSQGRTAKAPTSLDVPAVAVKVRGSNPPALAILPEQVAAQAGIEPVTTALLVSGPKPLTTDDQTALDSRLEAALGDPKWGGSSLAPVPRQTLAPALVALLIIAFALMLVGSLTAGLLSLSEARPDLVTLREVGAAPRVRRRIAATYGGGISLTGAVLGTLVGITAGIAATRSLDLRPMASDLPGAVLDPERSPFSVPIDGPSVSPLPGALDSWGHPIPDAFLVIPWFVVPVLVIGMPLVVSAVMYLTASSRLPRRIRTE